MCRETDMLAIYSLKMQTSSNITHVNQKFLKMLRNKMSTPNINKNQMRRTDRRGGQRMRGSVRLCRSLNQGNETQMKRLSDIKYE